MNKFQLDDTVYRIFRPDRRNMAIQGRRGSTWKTISYHGNDLEALSAGLVRVIVANYSPDEAKELVAQLEALRATVTDGVLTIEAALARRE